MRRQFTLQLYDRLDPDVCSRGDCQGPAPGAPYALPAPPLDMCLACARRRQGLSLRRTTGWWRPHIEYDQGGGTLQEVYRDGARVN